MVEHSERRTRPPQTKAEKLRSFIAQRSNTIVNNESFLQYTRDSIQEFRRKIEVSGYSTEDQTLIQTALNLAVVAYQDNDHVSRRTRRQTVLYQGERRQIPYIQHTLSVAEAMIGEPRMVTMAEYGSRTQEAIDLRVHQHAYKAEVIAAALLHDVIEDVRLRYPRRGILVEGREKWTEFLRGYFEKFGDQKVQSITTMITAVTKRGELRKGMIDQIYESEVFGAVREQLIRPDLVNRDAEIEKQVVRSLADLHYIVQSSFGMGDNLHFDDQSFRNFFGALAIKCHDIENNLEDGGVREDKMIRAQILAVFARIYGLPVASRIAAHLIIDTQHDMYWSQGDMAKNLADATSLVKIYAQLERQREKPSLTFFEDEERIKLQSDAIQIPIFSPDEIETTAGFRPTPQFRFTSGDEVFLDRMRRYYHSPDGVNVPIKIRGKNYVGIPIYEETQKAIISTGRQCYYFNVYRSIDGQIDPKNPQLIAIIRVQDDQPTAHDVLGRDFDIPARAVPETRLISSVYKGDPATAMNVFSITTSSVEI